VTQAMSSDMFREGRNPLPLCPGCTGGRLHPYKVSINLGPHGWQGVEYLDGWVAVCIGDHNPHGYLVEPAKPCGFSMPMTPHRSQRPA